jgi:hypothetical protein
MEETNPLTIGNGASVSINVEVMLRDSNQDDADI